MNEIEKPDTESFYIPVFPSEQGSGISLRALFAGMNMAGLLRGNPIYLGEKELIAASDHAIKAADVLIAKLIDGRIG